MTVISHILTQLKTNFFLFENTPLTDLRNFQICTIELDHKLRENKIHSRKILLLMNLNEMYEAFKLRNPDAKIGFSKFCELQPKWCVLVGLKGTRSVCVCQHHQNIKLRVSELPGDVDSKDLSGNCVA